jgi:dihydrofolate synthase / folylpolyglutamate synthase
MQFPMTYRETLDFLFSQLPMYHRIGAPAYKADLANTVELCRLLGNPERSFPSVHIAGTNGKGSVSHMIASVLQETGLKVGLYTSPHLRDFRERIRVNGTMIPKMKVVSFVHEHVENFKRIQPSFFEMTVALAFDYFREEEIDIGVIEVGMGGRLDSTNVITPLLSVITNISFDHKQFLGNTLRQIAGEKAGIIKDGIPVVIGETRRETSPVFLQHAKAHGSRIIFADKIFRSRISDPPQGKQDFLCLDIFRENKIFFNKLLSPLQGFYQHKNIVTVIACMEELRKTGIKSEKKEIVNGIRHVIRNTHLTGRWQMLKKSPLTICDTCHNPAGIRYAMNQIGKIKHKRLHFVFGVVNDKETAPIFRLLPNDAIYYFCKPDIPRGLDAAELKKRAVQKGLKGKVYPSVGEALKAAQDAAGPEDLVFVGGSSFIVAEVV